MNLWKSMGGMVELNITSADPGGILEALSGKNIPLHRIRYLDALTVSVLLQRCDSEDARRILEKKGASCKTAGKRGIFYQLTAAVKRPVLVSGLGILLLLTMLLPTRVLFIQVEGNDAVPTRLILEAAAESGIRFGASRGEVRSEKVKNALLGALPQLQWAGVNTSGCVATISVRERAEDPREEERREVSSLVALRDGIIVSCTVTEGSPLCTVGQAVKAGQTLISGYTDLGLLVQATRAEGEVMAQTRRNLTAVTLPEGLARGQVREEKRNYSLILGKKRINFCNSSRICDAACGRMYKEYYITLPGGFVLPVALAVDIHSCYDSEPFRKEPEEAFRALKEFARGYMLSKMVSGSILDTDLTAQTGSDRYCLEAVYNCLEMIGRRRQEK